MKKLLLCMIVLSLFACSKEEDGTLEPTGTQPNWFVIQDEPDDELKHAIYEVYEATKVPIFVEDTIGMENRGIDPYGNPYIHYEVLNVFYSIDRGPYSSHGYQESRNREDLLAGVKLLQQYTIPLLPYRIAPMSYFLVERVHESLSYDLKWYDGMRTTVVGNVSTFKSMTDSLKREFGAELASVDYAQFLMSYYEDVEELVNFFDVTNNVYGYNIYDDQLSSSGRPPLKTTPPEEYGVLRVKKIGSNVYTLSKKEDVSLFIAQILLNDRERFMEKYKDYKLVKDKYDIMSRLMKKALADIEKE